MISLDKVGVRFSGKELMADVSFLIDKKDKLGLVGKNGAGKSTLLKIIKGILEPSEGRLSFTSGLEIGYLPQTMVLEDSESVRDEARKAFADILILEQRITHLTDEIATRDDYESAAYLKLIDELTLANDRYAHMGGQDMEGRIEKVLLGLGFKRHEMDNPTASFSGGWRMRIELAKILLAAPDVLLLDEPTNHLDIESIQWLEQELVSFSGAIVLISHDKRFLDQITNRTIEISLGRIFDYRVAYSKYKELRAERLAQQEAAYRNQQKQIEDTERFIERFRYKATKSVQVQSRIKQLEKLDRVQIDEDDLSQVHFRFPSAPRSGSVVVEAKEFSKSYGPKLVIDGIDFELERGEKVAFVGKNGEGKSTFSKAIVGEIAYDGELKMGHNVQLGYFAQDQDKLMDGEKTVLETLDDIASGDIRKQLRDILGAFLFRGEDVEKKVKVLSGGERSRLAMAKLLLQPYNLLVLDEPTNHLDIASKEVLKKALIDYDGAMIVVSHDRDFLDGLLDSVYEFRDHKIKRYYGGVNGFLQKRALEQMSDIEAPKAKVENPTDEPEPASMSDNKLRYEQRREFDKKIRKQEQLVAQIEAEIEKLSEQIDSDNRKMADGTASSDAQFFIDYNQRKLRLETLETDWAHAGEALDTLIGERDILL